MSFRWRRGRRLTFTSHASGRGLATAAGMVLLALGAGCLDDQPTAGGRAGAGSARLALQAQITGARADEYDVRVRAYYEGAGGQEVGLGVSPAVLTVPAGTSASQALNLQVAPCFADEARTGAPGCRVGVELSLIDATGGVLSRQTQEAELPRPGVTVTMGAFTLPAAALTIDKTTLEFSAVAGGAAPQAQTITVGSTTGAELDLGAAVTGAEGNWLAAQYTARDAAGGTLSVVPTRTDLSPGTYNATVGISSGRDAIAIRTVAVTYTVAATGNGVVHGRVIDASTTLPLAGATVTLAPTGSTNPAETKTVVTGADGLFEFGALAGGRTYDMSASRDGYVVNEADGVSLSGSADRVLVDFSLPANGTERRTGTLVGRVVAGATGAPIANATVLISGGALTNGVFQTTTTDTYGNWALDAVGLDAPDGPVPAFTVFATASGFAPASQSLTVPHNATRANIRLELPVAGAVATYFGEGFESAGDNWPKSGLWNRIDLATTNVVNTAYPNFVQLAPGDASNGGLPDAAQGSFALWYGSPSTGNFIGTQSSGDTPGSGGTSVEANEGTITTPAITIPADAPAAALTFQTWFEIESVNPNQNGFDYMEVYVDEGGTQTLLGRLNPFQDPDLEPRDAIPFTSGGFNRPPVWRPAQFDLSAYKGKTFSLVFRFSTEDGLYNGFRGWLIDDVRVTNEVVISSVQARKGSVTGAPTLRRSGAPRAPRTPNRPR